MQKDGERKRNVEIKMTFFYRVSVEEKKMTVRFRRCIDEESVNCRFKIRLKISSGTLGY